MPDRSRSALRRRSLLTAPVLATALAACGSSSPGEGSASARAGYPVSLTNCSATVRFDAPPARTVMLESAPVTILDAIGALDSVVARAGTYPRAYYSDDLNSRIAKIPALTTSSSAAGRLTISQEVVLAHKPDLVLGLPDGVTREGLADAGARALVQDVLCEGEHPPARLDTLYSTIAQYGRIFGRPERAEKLTQSLKARVAAVTKAAEALRTKKIAFVYPSRGGGPLFTYGAGSMTTAQATALGLTNVFAGQSTRVFEVGAEAFIASDPDAIVMLYQSETDGRDQAREMVSADGLGSMRAVKKGAVLPLLFNYSEPASPLVVDGLERIHTWLVGIEKSAA